MVREMLQASIGRHDIPDPLYAGPQVREGHRQTAEEAAQAKTNSLGGDFKRGPIAKARSTRGRNTGKR